MSATVEMCADCRTAPLESRVCQIIFKRLLKVDECRELGVRVSVTAERTGWSRRCACECDECIADDVAR